MSGKQTDQTEQESRFGHKLGRYVIVSYASSSSAGFLTHLALFVTYAVELCRQYSMFHMIME
jgi:hypothetical protein